MFKRFCPAPSDRARAIRRPPGWTALSACLALSLVAGGRGAAQTPADQVWDEVFAGSELEDYLRAMQVAGVVAPHPLSIRSLSFAELERLVPRDSDHPWAERYSLAPAGGRGLQLDWVAPSARATYNSAIPYGFNDGAAWAGRGLTTELRAGVALRYGPLSARIAPTFFRAENDAFDLAADPRGEVSFPHPLFAATIDLPQRFGSGAYQRLDPGQSGVRLDLAGLAAGVSTANQVWGPATDHPIILGNHAAGFPHLFVGTTHPVDLWVGRVHGRMIWGELTQSDYSTVTHPDSVRRLASGGVATFSPRGVPGLEIGATRFFHTPWTREISADLLLKPLDGFLKKNLADRDTVGDDTKQDFDNQLASVFARWVFPGSGFEVYGEYGRDDHNWNKRDLVLVPDHMSAYLLGFSRVWERSAEQWVVLRGELLNSRRSHLHRVRDQAPFGVHAWTRQGHTQRGQMLGSAAEFGGAGSVLALERYNRRGRLGVSWDRWQRGDNVAYFLRRTVDPNGLDVVHALGVDGRLFAGRWDLEFATRGVYELNRDFTSDVFNLNLVLGLRARL